MTLAKEMQQYDGHASKASKQRKERSSFSGIRSAENYVQRSWGDVFDYDSLDGRLKELIDWFFDADFPKDLEHEGLEADEVSVKLADGHLPQGFDLEKLRNWILGIKGKLKDSTS